MAVFEAGTKVLLTCVVVDDAADCTAGDGLGEAVGAAVGATMVAVADETGVAWRAVAEVVPTVLVTDSVAVVTASVAAPAAVVVAPRLAVVAVRAVEAVVAAVALFAGAPTVPTAVAVPVAIGVLVGVAVAVAVGVGGPLLGATWIDVSTSARLPADGFCMAR